MRKSIYFCAGFNEQDRFLMDTNTLTAVTMTPELRRERVFIEGKTKT